MAGVKGRSGGRNAKTVTEHALNGTFDKARHGETVNPTPPSGMPRPPKPLDGDARSEWDRMLTRLQLSRTLSVVDDGMLYQHCRLFAETEELVEEKAEARAAVDRLLESQGDVDKGDLLAFFQELGKMQKLAASYDSKLRSNRMALRVSYVEFGLTPASRGRVKVADTQPDDDPFAEFDGAQIQ